MHITSIGDLPILLVSSCGKAIRNVEVYIEHIAHCREQSHSANVDRWAKQLIHSVCFKYSVIFNFQTDECNHLQCIRYHYQNETFSSLRLIVKYVEKIWRKTMANLFWSNGHFHTEIKIKCFELNPIYITNTRKNAIDSHHRHHRHRQQHRMNKQKSYECHSPQIFNDSNIKK